MTQGSLAESSFTERILNIFASIVTLTNVVIAVPQSFNTTLNPMGFDLFSKSHIVFRLALVLILEVSLSYLLARLIKLTINTHQIKSLLISLLCIVSVAVTFYNIEYILFGGPVNLVFESSCHSLTIKILVIFSLFLVLSIVFPIKLGIELDKDEGICYYILPLLYLIFFIALFFNN